MTVYGYVRVSDADQNPARQLAKMEALGIPDGNVLVDKASGGSMDRAEWLRLMGCIGEGDVVFVDALDRLGRDYDDITREWKRITREVGCDIAALDLDFMDSRKFREFGDLGKVLEDMILSVLAWKAERERTDIKRRQAEGIAIAKAEGKYRGGTRRSYPPEVVEAASAALSEGGKSAAAKVLGCTRGTVYRMIEDGRLRCA